MFRTRPARLLAAIAFTVGLLAAACGSDGDSDSDSVSSDGSPESWVDAFCQAGINLAEDLGPVADELESEFADFDPNDLEGGFEELFAVLFGVLGDFAEPFGTFIDDVRSLGAPDVEGGEEFYDALVTSLDAADQAFAALADLPENPTLADLQSLGETDPFAGLEGFDGLDDFSDGPAELAEAAEESDNCKTAEEKFAEFESKLDSLEQLG